MRLTHILIVLGVLSAVSSQSRAFDRKNFSVALKGSLTTGSQVFPHANSSDEFQRAQYFSIKDIWGYGIEVRYRFPETDLALALSADYLHITQASAPITLSGMQIPVTDGYRVIPVELTGYFFIPISGEVVGVYIGAGAGAYFGRRIYQIGNTEASAIGRQAGMGIHVLSGISYRINNFLSLNAEMKFRDLQFKSTNAFSASSTQYGGVVLPLDTTPSVSQIHTDGMIVQLGVVFEL